MQKFSVRSVVVCSVCCALTCVLSMFSIPIQPVPITLATLSVYISGAFVGPRLGALSQTLYLVLVLVGVPCTAKLVGGVSVFVGPTAGFLIAYVPTAFVIGLLYGYYRKKLRGGLKKILGLVAALLLGTFVCYILGLLWYMIYSGVDIYKAFLVCVLPFLLGDGLKIATVALIVPRLEKIINIDFY